MQLKSVSSFRKNLRGETVLYDETGFKHQQLSLVLGSDNDMKAYKKEVFAALMRGL
tara:strand:- start:432 stop:599 length:168 start_codon:yes stop_codon:yes gene_type:complete